MLALSASYHVRRPTRSGIRDHKLVPSGLSVYVAGVSRLLGVHATLFF
jgi:hypothetical protein